VRFTGKLLFTQSKQTLTGRAPEKRIKHRERCTLASRISYINEFKNTYVVESWFNYWILCETVLPGQGGVPRLAKVDFTDTDASRHRI
jgi:hypothetical protein